MENVHYLFILLRVFKLLESISIVIVLLAVSCFRFLGIEAIKGNVDCGRGLDSRNCCDHDGKVGKPSYAIIPFSLSASIVIVSYLAQKELATVLEREFFLVEMALPSTR